jgi:hypothetical protein
MVQRCRCVKLDAEGCRTKTELAAALRSFIALKAKTNQLLNSSSLISSSFKRKKRTAEVLPRCAFVFVIRWGSGYVEQNPRVVENSPLSHNYPH